MNSEDSASERVLTASEFMARNRLSRTKFYDLIKAGRGPRMMLGRITRESEAAWRRRMEEEEESEAAQLEHLRRVSAAKHAARFAAASPRHVSKKLRPKKKAVR